MMVEALGVDPKNCVYLEMGMTTIKVLNASQAIDELEAATRLSLR
jgi:putative hydrolase of the HAD superfamily